MKVKIAIQTQINEDVLDNIWTKAQTTVSDNSIKGNKPNNENTKRII